MTLLCRKHSEEERAYLRGEHASASAPSCRAKGRAKTPKGKRRKTG